MSANLSPTKQQNINMRKPRSACSNEHPSHLHPLQVENCDSNSRLVVDEAENLAPDLELVIMFMSSRKISV